MKNINQWKSSKFVFRRGKLVGSRNPKEVDISSRLISDAIASRYDKNIKIHCKGRLIDLGCGKVPLYQAYKNYVTENICVDWPSTVHGISFLDYQCDLSKPLPFSDNEFDTIILSDVLEHLLEPEQLWQEMFRILKEEGKCLLNVPFYYWLHEEPHDYFRYTHFALKRFAERAGFNVLILESIGGAPEVMADILAKNIMFVPVIGKYFAIAIQWGTQFFISTGIGKKISQKTGKKFPIGYFMIVEKRNKYFL